MFNLLYNSIDFTTIAKIDLQIAKVAPKILFYAILDRWIKKSYNYSNKLEKRLKMNREKNLKRVGVYTENEYLLLLCRAERTVFLGELLELLLFSVEYLRYLDTREIFRKIGVYIGGAILYLTVCAP